MAEETLLRIEKLLLHFRTGKGVVQAVDGVDFVFCLHRQGGCAGSRRR